MVQQVVPLTKCPSNLKEAIDYLTWFRGFGWASGLKKYIDLADAFDKLPAFDTAKVQALGSGMSLGGFINGLADGLGYGFLGYDSQGAVSFSGNKGIIDPSKEYKSAYAEAQWPSEGDRQTCALIFLGTAPIVYLCLSYIYWRCTYSQNGHWGTHFITQSNAPFGQFMEAMGYDTSRLNGNIQGNQVAKLLATEDIHCFTELTKATGKSNYSTFLHKLETYDSNEALKHPLASCYKLAKEYFESQSKFKAPNASEINEAIKEIKNNLIQLSAAEEYSSSGDSSTNPYDNLKPLITQLLSAVQKFQAKEPEQFGQGVHHAAGQAGKEAGESGGQPSSGSSIAGALTTLGLGGGAAAAYVLNLGGAKTLINGLLRIG
ncbi:uncharacterized protein BcabD6B2_42140 [Babesia caballi]|uniref:Uncharacterized protein n=1 Tax=Babesia caballi TaxID=5871 RepID=A0AAV4LXI2_BABCB|nr:hypothetical protein, conserved [Babesia caballi]